MDKYLLLIIYAIYLASISVITFFIFGIDKNKAEKNDGPNRIKERTLLSLVAIGGAVGGFLGRIIFRHKTKKIYFSFVIYLSLIFEAAIVALMIYFVTK